MVVACPTVDHPHPHPHPLRAATAHPLLITGGRSKGVVYPVSLPLSMGLLLSAPKAGNGTLPSADVYLLPPHPLIHPPPLPAMVITAGMGNGAKQDTPPSTRKDLPN